MAISLNAVFQGDSLERLAQVPADKVDLVFADPPFNIGYEYDVYQDQLSNREYLDWSRKWISGVWKALQPAGTFWLAIGDEYAAELKVIAQDVGFSCRSWVIWYYTFGVNCRRGFSRSHTHLFHFVKDPAKFTFNADNPAVRLMSARQLVYADLRANPKGRLPDNTWILRPQDAPRSAFDPMHDTWYFSRVAGTFKEREGFHGCQMPEQLLGRIIRLSSNPQDLVMDPFAGSGTTLAVAKKLGRQWLGFDLSPEYVKRVKSRLEKTQVGDPLDGPENPIDSAPATSRGRKNVRLRAGKSLPHADEATEQGVIAAYKEVARNSSTDFLLCDRELNAAFVACCETKELPGSAFVWNRLLLRLRKSGKLPKSNEHATRLSFQAMDSFSFASEIAMQLVGLDYDLTLDDILCSPEVANVFDEIAGGFAPQHTSFEYRWAALAIRKRAIKAKELAKQQFQEWRRKTLPKSVPLSNFDSEKFDGAGVYVLANCENALYIGETYDLRTRIGQIMQTEGWKRLDPRSVKIISVEDPPTRQGLQSMLIHRIKPMLNSSLLRPELHDSPA